MGPSLTHGPACARACVGAAKALVEYLSSHLPRLDIIINNAAQTIAR
jgi:short-subunit dehydrogenase involved in D-alanine esterification of teichoic acids